MLHPSYQRSPTQPIARPTPLGGRLLSALLFGGVLAWALAQAGVGSRDLVNEGGWTLAWRFVRAVVRPDFSAEFLGLAAHSMLITLGYAVCGTALSVLIGGVGGVAASQVWWQSVYAGPKGRWRWLATTPWMVVRGLLSVPRAIHEVIWGLFLINIIGLDPLVAILAIGLPFGAITAIVFANILDETPRDAFDALRGSGVGTFRALLYTIIPQAFPTLLSYTFYRFECAIRAAAVLGIIGAGGLGYQILLSLQALRYEQMWTFLFALIVLSGLTDMWSSALRRRLHLASRIDLHTGQRQPPSSLQPGGDLVAKASLLGAVLLVPWGFWYVGADVRTLWAPRTVRLLHEVLQTSFWPRINAPLLAELFYLAGQTISMSILAITFAGVGGLVLSFFAARTLGGPLASMLARGALLVARALGEPIWTFIVLLVLFPGILPGAIGLGLYNLGILGRLMAEVAEDTDQRPLAALRAQGATGAQVFMYGVLPLTLPRNLAYVLYRWEVCIRATVIVGLVGAGGLGRLLAEQLSRFDTQGTITTLYVLVGLTLLVDLISAVARRSLR